MAIWCMTHPWMTFFIAMFAIAVINNVAVNVIRIIKYAMGMPLGSTEMVLKSTGDSET